MYGDAYASHHHKLMKFVFQKKLQKKIANDKLQSFGQEEDNFLGHVINQNRDRKC